MPDPSSFAHRKELLTAIVSDTASFYEANRDEVDTIAFSQEDTCCICGTDGEREWPVPIPHCARVGCIALAHPDCLSKWREVRDRKTMRVFKCPICKVRIAGVPQPPPPKPRVCGTYFPETGDHCKLKHGHLGNCVRL